MRKMVLHQPQCDASLVRGNGQAALTLEAKRQGVFGAGAHSDYGMLTLLRTDDAPGLQVRLRVQLRPLLAARLRCAAPSQLTLSV